MDDDLSFLFSNEVMYHKGKHDTLQTLNIYGLIQSPSYCLTSEIF